MKQQSFFKSKSEHSANRISHGGDAKGRRKLYRPLDRKRPLHVTLKSSHAKGKMSFLTAKNKLAVNSIISKNASSCRVTVHQLQNVGNHLHMMVSFKDRKLMQKFMRTVAGIIARVVTGARRGKAFGQKFWDGLAFTRIITSRRDFAAMLKYMSKNEIERELGRDMRSAIELHEKATRDAKRRGLSLHDLLAEWAEKLAKSQVLQSR